MHFTLQSAASARDIILYCFHKLCVIQVQGALDSASSDLTHTESVKFVIKKQIYHVF